MTEHDDFVVEEIRRALSGVHKSPLESYAIALELLRAPAKPLTRGVIKGVEDIARAYARESLRDGELGSWALEMPVKHDDFGRFTSYHRRCRIRLVEFMATGELIKATGSDWVWYNTRCGVCPIVVRSNVISSTALGVQKDPALWWVRYWERVVAAVGETPCEGPFEDESIWGDTLRALARECTLCHEAAAREFPVFRGRLVDVVANIIDGVRITFGKLVGLTEL